VKGYLSESWVSLLLGSQNYLLNKLQNLCSEELTKVREAFTKNSHMRFMNSFSCHLPFGTKDAYVKEIMVADLDKLAGLIRICGFLMQTKVYVSWHVS
jgi:hypothetical protein